MFDVYRLCIIVACVLVIDCMYDGVLFGEIACWLVDEHGFSVSDVIGVFECAYRGGGVV